jgi:hypothetical protein
MLNKKNILDSFIIVPESFVSFINSYRYRLLQKSQDKDKLIKKIYISACDKDYLIIHKNKIYYCNKNQYKQMLFNMRSKKANEYKNLLKRYGGNNSKDVWKSVVAYKKIELPSSFEISIYDVKTNKSQMNFLPFVSIAEQTRAKYNGTPIAYSKKEIKRGALRFPNF